MLATAALLPGTIIIPGFEPIMTGCDMAEGTSMRKSVDENYLRRDAS
jgi:hypothetical protein